LKRALLTAGILCLLLALSFFPIARADTVQQVQVSGKPLSPVVDTSNGDVYVPSNGPGSDTLPGNVSVISGASLVGTVSMTFGKPGSSCTSKVDLKPATYDAGNGYVYVPSAAGDCSGLGVISGTSVVEYVDVLPIWSDRAAYDPNDGYVYVPVGKEINTVCAERCTIGNSTGPLYIYTYYGGISAVQDLTTVYNISIGLHPGEGAFNASEDPDVQPAFDPNNGYIYAPDNDHNVVYVISGTSLIATLSLGNKPGVPVVDTSTGDVYVPMNGSSIAVISGTTVSGTISTSAQAVDLTYDPSDGYMYAAGLSGVYVISGTSVVATIPMSPGGYPAYDPNNGYVYVSDARAGTVVAISGTSVAFTDTVGGIPADVVFDPVNGYLYTNDNHNGRVDVIIPLSGLVSPTTSCSSSASITTSSSTSSTTTTSTACCQSTSSTSRTTTTSSTTTSTCSSSSATGPPVLINATSVLNSTPSEQSPTSSSPTDTNSSSSPSSSGVGLGTPEIAAIAIGAIAAAGAGIWYFTQQGGGSEDASDGEGESPPGGCAPESPPSCGPVSPTVGRATRAVCTPCGTSVEQVTGPSAGSNPLTGHATRVLCTPCTPLEVVCGPTAGSNPLAGRATRVVCTPSSSPLDVVSGPSACSNPLASHATRAVCIPCCASFAKLKQVGPCGESSASVRLSCAQASSIPQCQQVATVKQNPLTGRATRCLATPCGASVGLTSGPSVASPCSVPSSLCSSAPTGRAMKTPVGCGPLSRASCTIVGPCGEGHATRIVCTPGCQQVAKVKQVGPSTQAHSCVRLSCAETASIPQCQPVAVVKPNALTGSATRQVCIPCCASFAKLKQVGPCGESSASVRLSCAEASSVPPGTVQQVKTSGQVTGRATRTSCSIPQGQLRAVKQTKTQPSCGSSSNGSGCESSANDTPQCDTSGIDDSPEA
jgi:DNA-binding beta-propeller fold protein YncE